MAYTFKYGDRPIEGVTVQRAVGRGGFGEVYYALTDSGKQIALKFLKDNAEVELRGIGNVLNLKSPYLITIFDVKKNAEGDPFVVMEYVGGPNLRDLMNAEPNGMPLPKAAFFLHGIAKGLAYLHDRGIVHRDLKPANIFFDDGFVKIGDYGLSKHMSVSRHSAQTMSVGTVHYMAPEIGSGHYTKAIDVYALGVILYEMLTGRLPFHGASMGEILMKHLSEKPNLVGIPEPFATVIGKALAKDPAARYQDANEMLAAAMSSSEVSANIAGFDANALTQVMRANLPPEAEMTLTAGGFRGPPPPPPPLDVHEAGDWRQQIRNVRDQVREAAREIRGQAAQFRREVVGISPNDAKRPSRFSRIMTILIVALVLSFGMALVSDTHDAAPMVIALMFYFLGGTAATLVTYRWLQNHEAAGTVIERILFAGVGLAFMSVGLGPASAVGDHEFMRSVTGPVIALAICNWRRRVDSGRSGKISVGDAIAPAIVGAIAAGAAEGNPLFGAGISAAISLLTQAAAAAWPHRNTTQAFVSAAPPQPAPPEMPVTPIAPAYAGEETEKKKPAFFANVVFGLRGAGSTPPTAPAVDSTANDDSRQPTTIDVSQPSFAGRCANAGLGFIGKLLCVAALTVAFLYHGLPHSSVEFKGANWKGEVDNGKLIYEDLESGKRKIMSLQNVAPTPIILAFFAGAALLFVSRRRQGGKHLSRAVMACVFGGVATIFALKDGGAGIRTFMETGGEPSPKAIITLIFLGISLLMLFWPAPRDPRTIVV